MKKLAFVVLTVLLVFPAPLHAQPSLTIVWTQNETLTEAQGNIYRLWVDALAPVILQAVECKVNTTVTPNLVECRAPMPLPSVGLHKVAVSAQNAYGEEKSAPIDFRYPAVPPAPKDLRVEKGT